MKKWLLNKWTIVISIFIITSTVFYTIKDKNNNEKITVETVNTKNIQN